MTKRNHTKYLVLTAVLGAISAILMILEFPMPFIPAFIKMDFSDLPIVLGGFIMGPINGIFISIIKIALHLMLKGTSTFGIGEIANFIYSIGYMLPAVLVYRKLKTKKGAVLSLIIGTVVTSILAVLVNTYFTFPIYGKLMGLDIPSIVAMGASKNGLVTNLPTLMFCSIFPFNLFKYGVTSAITFVIYKKLSIALKHLIDQK